MEVDMQVVEVERTIELRVKMTEKAARALTQQTASGIAFAKERKANDPKELKEFKALLEKALPPEIQL